MKILGIAGYSGSGKTTLIEKVVPLLVGEGLRVSLIKHAHHEFEVDRPGKDSYRHREAGCSEVLVGSSRRWALMRELRNEPEPGLEELLNRLSPCDLVLVEGYKSDPIARIEVHRAGGDRPLLFPHDPHVIAVATDERLDTALPQFGLDDALGVARFILEFVAAGEGSTAALHTLRGLPRRGLA
jgi:molybdopterin-guanine dinucleotide biosynthesis protein B